MGYADGTTTRHEEASVGWRRFLALWLAQTTSMTAGGLTSFAIGIWIFQRTGSATAYAMMTLVTTLPSVVCLPLAGALADRWGWKRTLVVADLASAAIGAALVGVYVAGLATNGILYLLLALAALVGALHWPAYTAATTSLVDKERVARAAAMMQFGYVGYHVVAPAAAGALVASVGVPFVLGVDVTSFAVASGVVLTLPFARRGTSPGSAASVRKDLADAWREVRSLGLLPLAAYVAATYLPGGFVVALSTPLVLSIASPKTVGIVLSVIGSGMVVGSVVSTVLVRSTGGRRRLLLFDVAMGTAMLLASIAASPKLIAAAGFLFMFGFAGHTSEEQALWQVRVAADVQGRAFALRRMLTWSSLPVSYALAGPLADFVFEPLMATSGPLAPSIGALIGTGRGRGIALLLMCAGVVKLLVVLAASRSRALRRLDA